MGIFSRFRDIVSSNLNAMLDRAEDPEKMVRLMIQEMEDTLIEVKASCAGVMAEQKKLERVLEAARLEAADWDAKAKLAIEKGRDDLARAALAEKRRVEGRIASLQTEQDQTQRSVASFQEDIAALETKLADAREKQRTIVQRRAAATARVETARRIRTVDTSEAFAKFEAFENGIDRLEAEGRLTDGFRPRRGQEALRDQFQTLEQQEEIERELNRLKNELNPGKPEA